MKKLIFLFMLSCWFSLTINAQLKEVRGVTTLMVEYYSEKYSQLNRGLLKGFEFKNENNYRVWVEAECWKQEMLIIDTYNQVESKLPAHIVTTKSFTLNPGESYIWNCGENMIRKQRNYLYDDSDKCYVKYKAFKAE